MGRRTTLVTAIMLGACHAGASKPGPQPQAASSRFLFVWAGDADRRQSDFLAVIDVDARSANYASVVATVPVGAAGTRPHHTEYEMPATGVLWANGFDSGQTFRFDLRDPTRPHVVGSVGDAGPFSHPHSYARLSNGNILATFQRRAGSGHAETGGLVEFDSDGRVVRYANAAVPAIDSGVRPYSLAVVPALDRVVTTATDMHLQARSRAVQVWRLSDLTLLQTILLPAGPRGDEHSMTAEPRLLEDGRTVLVTTFTCGLYLLRGLAGDTPAAEWVYSTPWHEPPYCAVPVVAGHFWLQTSGPEHAVLSLDISDPSRPREVGRLTLRPDEIPHWIALEPKGDRLVITGYRELELRVLLARLDRTTGALRTDRPSRPPAQSSLGWTSGVSGGRMAQRDRPFRTEPCSAGPESSAPTAVVVAECGTLRGSCCYDARNEARSFRKDAPMIFDITTFTLIHVVLSLLGIFAGLVVAGGLVAGERLNGWTGLFLATTVLTNVTGFGFPFRTLLPSHIVGAVSLLVLPVAIAARYWKHLIGGWRQVFVVSTVLALYLNVFVLLVQLFQKTPALIVIAPTQKEPPFLVTQLVVLALFVWLGRAAVKGFRAESVAQVG